MKPIHLLFFALLVVVLLGGCEPSVPTDAPDTPTAFVDEAEVAAVVNRYVEQVALQVAAGKQESDALSREVFVQAIAPYVTELMAGGSPPPFEELHRTVQDYLARAQGHPEQRFVERMVGHQMLTRVIPYVREPVPDEVKLDYVALMIHGMSTEFPTILSVLENTRGHEARVRRLAREALVNTWALERIHEERLEAWKEGLAALPASFTHRRDVEAALVEMAQSWPPYVELADGSSSRGRLDMGSVRTRLAQLMR
ncbi:MAG: hypothetical protein KatS3mg042_1748 [Rhodothermaceae bacterium]|nr:MAG: hypothetical protein KatS3mg042_1748 [Rhodothermaceae bacterium]GIW56705.1 MAG: hypothetical protein KatS3mg082_3109 [Nitrospiraceae bacterium]